MPAARFTLTLPQTSVTYKFTIITNPDYVYLQESGGSILTSGPGDGLGQFTATAAFLTAINAEVPYTYFAYENDCTDPKLATYTILNNSLRFSISGSAPATYTFPVSVSSQIPIPSLIPKYTVIPPSPRKRK
jgi:hypothetical protein